MPAEETHYRGFEQGPIRPPSEARSLLVRVTRNCPWNRCRFCPVYKDTDFSRRPLTHVLADIEAVAAWVETFAPQAVRRRQATLSEPGAPSDHADPGAVAGPPLDPGAEHAAWNWYRNGMKSVFLQDANPLAVPPSDMIAILSLLKERFPSIERITTYARSRTVARIAPEDLAKMREAGLDRVHIGFESGSDEILGFMDKGVTKAVQVEAGRRIKAAGMELSAYYMPGLGGKSMWRENALETADLMNQVNPDFIRLRTLAIPDHLVLAEDVAQGRFEKASDMDNAQEILLFLDSLEGITSTVVSDHILNLFENVGGTLPGDRDLMTAEIRAFLALDPQEQVLYRIARRAGLVRGMFDLDDPQRLDRAQRLVQELQVTPENVDAVTDQMVKRFI
jgi:histone acetyltransferase (RNA polymerase elongator complex component)